MGAARTGPSPRTQQEETRAADTALTVPDAPDGAVYAPLAAAIRTSTAASVQAQIAHLADVQGSIRGKDGRIKKAKFHAAVLALRWEGFTPKETAEILGCSHGRVDNALLRMRESAELDDQIKRIEQQIVPLAVDNVAQGVLKGDRVYTLKVLEGRGVFRTHKSVEGEIKKTILHLKIITEMPKHLGPDAIPMPVVGSIVGAPVLLAAAETKEPT
jgi:hypothetical protein